MFVAFLRYRTWLIRYYNSYKKEGVILKEIGEALREARENIGISIEEAANDLKLRPSQIENLEAGKREAFKDVFFLKYFIRDYSKYLGLNYEDMIDEFNEYLFECTSKISLDEIKKAKKKLEKNQKKEDKKIRSPYTLERDHRIYIPTIIIYIIITILVLGIGYYIFSLFDGDDFQNENDNIITRERVIR